MRLIDADALKKAIEQEHQRVLKINPICSSISLNMLNEIIDNAPTVEQGHYLTNCQNCKSDYSRGYDDGYAEGYKDGMTGADWKGEEK